MLTGIDHVILAVPDVDGAAAQVEASLGLRVAAGGRHEAHGTHNRLVWLGDSYVELMGVFDEALARGSWWGRVVLEFLEARGAGLAGVVLASDDIDLDAGRLRAAGSVLAEPQLGERARPDGAIVRWRLAARAQPDPDLGLAFLIEHDTSAAEWTPADRARRAGERHPLGGPVALRRVEVAVADMHSATMRIHRDLGVQFRPSLAGGGARDGAIGRQTLRLVRRAGQPPRLFLAGGTRSVTAGLLGCDWSIEAAPEDVRTGGTSSATG